MSDQLHNLGFLRMSVEDALVALLKTGCGAATVRPAYTTDAMEFPCVTVHASATRERNEQDYNLARYVDVEIRCITYAEPDGLLEAREAHFNLVACVYHTLAQADAVTLLNGLAVPRVAFWSCYAMTDAGGVIDGAYLSTIAVEIGATPQPI
jgi:hypothetical protein